MPARDHERAQRTEVRLDRTGPGGVRGGVKHNSTRLLAAQARMAGVLFTDKLWGHPGRLPAPPMCGDDDVTERVGAERLLVGDTLAAGDG